MQDEDPYFYDVQIATRYQGKKIAVHHFAALFRSTEIWRAALEDRLSSYAPPIPEAQIAVLFGLAIDFVAIVSHVYEHYPAWLDITRRLADAGEPFWKRNPGQRRDPPTWRPKVSE